MTERKPIADMSGSEFGDLLATLSRSRLESMLIYLSGYAPEAVERALGISAAFITDAERTCDARNPLTGEWCNRSDDHGTHRDADGGEWTS